MELESIVSIPVGDVLFHVLGKIDDSDGLERTPLDTESTANTENLRYGNKCGLWGNRNANASGFVDRASLLALLAAFLGLALFRIDNGYSELRFLHLPNQLFDRRCKFRILNEIGCCAYIESNSNYSSVFDGIYHGSSRNSI